MIDKGFMDPKETQAKPLMFIIMPSFTKVDYVATSMLLLRKIQCISRHSDSGIKISSAPVTTATRVISGDSFMDAAHQRSKADLVKDECVDQSTDESASDGNPVLQNNNEHVCRGSTTTA
ncbi:hypothetical protein CHS0354_040485 [Potamilus streckersoni]|uniref:Uncharacterized protein n=1 Tax=Potamilus streckersoni TaxID=2493646 RepID=A0AAE0TKZ4_9BIVA|nr:hypothetical protein CHS0354_040485 [Potamilus streckersoni]